jgi:hypothetical protein
LTFSRWLIEREHVKPLLIAIFASACAWGQFADVTVTLPDPSTQEWGLSTTYKATSFPNTIQWIETTPPVSGAFPNVNGTPSNTTLGAAITQTGTHALCTTYSVTGASANAICDQITPTTTTNLAQCNGLMIGSEMDEVFTVSGQTVTVIRGTLGTTRATASNGAAVKITRTGGGTCLTKAILADGVNQITLAMRADPTTQTAVTTINTNQATVTSTAAQAIQ